MTTSPLPFDERLIVSPEVMACLEADFPDAARHFQVDPVRAEYENFPQRWVSGLPGYPPDERIPFEELLRRTVPVNWDHPQPPVRPDTVHIAGYTPAPTDEVTP